MKKQPKNETLAFCTVCSKNFVYIPKAKRVPKYCSPACKQQAYRIKHNKTKKATAAATITSMKLSLQQANEKIKQLEEKLKKSSLLISDLKKELKKYNKNLFD